MKFTLQKWMGNPRNARYVWIAVCVIGGAVAGTKTSTKTQLKNQGAKRVPATHISSTAYANYTTGGIGAGNDLASLLWGQNGYGEDPVYYWLPDGMRHTLLAPVDAQVRDLATPAWPDVSWPAAASGALFQNLGIGLAREVELPFAFPFAGKTHTRIAVGTDGRIIFPGSHGVTHHRRRGDGGLPLLSRVPGFEINSLFVYWADWELRSGSVVEMSAFDAYTPSGLTKGVAVRWAGMRLFGAGAHTVNFGAVLWETGDVVVSYGQGAEWFKHAATSGAQCGANGAHWVSHDGAVFDVMSDGLELYLKRLMPPSEASQDLCGDGSNRFLKWLYDLDETKISNASDGIDDFYKIRFGLDLHSNIAQEVLVPGGLPLLTAYRYQCDPWQLGAPYLAKIAAGLDPNSGWVPASVQEGAETVWFTFNNLTPKQGIASFRGISGDPREERWIIGPNDGLSVGVPVWQGCENQIIAPPGGVVNFSGNGHSMGVVPIGIHPGQQQDYGWAEGQLLCYEVQMRAHWHLPYAASYSFRRCWPHFPGEVNSRGFNLTGPSEWCRQEDPPATLWHIHQHVDSVTSRDFVPCGCPVWVQGGVLPDSFIYRHYATTSCGCVLLTMDTKLLRPEVKISPLSTVNVPHDLGSNTVITVSTPNYDEPMTNHYYATADVVRFLNGGFTQHIERLKFANGQYRTPIDSEITITWDGILTEDDLQGFPGSDEFQGTNSIGISAVMKRQFSGAPVNTAVPVPFYEVLVTIWHECEEFPKPVVHDILHHRVHVPQIVVVKWDINAMLRFTFGQVTSTNKFYLGELAIDMTGAPDIVEWAQEICDFLQEKFPPGMNVQVLNGHDPDTHIQNDKWNVKTIMIVDELLNKSGKLVDALGYASSTECSVGNKLRAGSCSIGLQRCQRAVAAHYDRSRRTKSEEESLRTWRDLLAVMKEVAPHEVGHLFGLVSVRYVNGDPEQEEYLNDLSHNITYKNKIRIAPDFIMDGELFLDLTMSGLHRSFKPKSKEYLEFILPKPLQQGN